MDPMEIPHAHAAGILHLRFSWLLKIWKYVWNIWKSMLCSCWICLDFSCHCFSRVKLLVESWSILGVIGDLKITESTMNGEKNLYVHIVSLYIHIVSLIHTHGAIVYKGLVQARFWALWNPSPVDTEWQLCSCVSVVHKRGPGGCIPNHQSLGEHFWNMDV